MDVYDNNWEDMEYILLDNILEENTDTETDNSMDIMMNLYLSNTNLLSKRMMSATLVKPHSSESGLMVEHSTELINDENKDILSKDNVSSKDMIMSRKDIFLSKQRYISGTGTQFKRKCSDPGDWWLPSDWQSTRSRRWPSSASSSTAPPGLPSSTGTSSSGRWTGRGDRRLEPEWVDSLIREQNNHKQLWSTLDLTSMKLQGDADGDPHSEDGQGVAGGHLGARDDGVRDGEVRVAGAGSMHTMQAVEVGDRHHSQPGAIDRGGGARVGGAGELHDHRADDGRGHLEHDSEQQSRIIVKGRKYRLRDGASRDGRLQLGIKTFTVSQNLGEGGSSGLEVKGSTEDRDYGQRKLRKKSTGTC